VNGLALNIERETNAIKFNLSLLRADSFQKLLSQQRKQKREKFRGLGIDAGVTWLVS